MNKQTDNFTETYLKSLNVIKQDAEKEITECGDTEIVQDKDQQADEEDIDVDVDDENVDLDDDSEAGDDSEEDSEEQTEKQEQEQDEEQASTCFCFKTTNKDLIDAINSGFEEAVFFVKAKDDDGNDTVTEVKFKSEDFGDIEECDCDDEQDKDDQETDDVCPECGKEPCECEINDEEQDEQEEQDQDEEFDGANSFESVFNHYYRPLVSEATDYSGDLEIREIKDWKEMEEIKSKYLRPKQIPWNIVKNEEEFNKMKKLGPIKLAFAGNKLYAAGIQLDKNEGTKWYNKQDYQITDDDRLN